MDQADAGAPDLVIAHLFRDHDIGSVFSPVFDESVEFDAELEQLPEQVQVEVPAVAPRELVLAHRLGQPQGEGGPPRHALAGRLAPRARRGESVTRWAALALGLPVSYTHLTLP